MEIVPNKSLSLCLLSAAIRLLGITRGVSFRVRGQSSPHRAKQRLSPGRARDHPVMEIVPNKALSLSLSLSLGSREQGLEIRN